jgi:hypothetical protein
MSSAMLRSVSVIFLAYSLTFPNYSFAQGKPQYLKVHPTGVTPSGFHIAYYSAPFEKELPRKLQVIYKPKLISPTPPAGYVKSIYFYAGSNKYWPTTGALYNVQVKMGYSTRDSFNKVSWASNRYVRDTFITGLTTVFSADSLSIDLKNNFRYWLKVPLTSPGFYYSGAQDRNLVVELSFGNTPWVRSYFSLMDSATGDSWRLLAGYRDSIDVVAHSPTEFMVGTYGGLDFGFDLVPGAAVHEPAIIVGELYPNPASSLLYLPIKGAKGRVSFSVNTVDGKSLLKQQQALNGGQSTLSLRIKDLPPGNYMLSIEAGEDKVQRKFTKL